MVLLFSRNKFKEGNIDININVSDVEISGNGKDFYTSLDKDKLINANDSYGTIKNQLPNTLSRISSIGEVNKGNLVLFYEKVKNNDSGYLLSSEKQSDDKCNNSECSKNYYIAFDLYFKSDEPKNIGLTSKSYVKQKDDNGLENAVRIAFVVEGSTNTGNLNEIQKLSGGINAIIWEPNNDIHTKEAINFAKDVYRQDIDGRIVAYKAINDSFEEININGISKSAKFSNVNPNISTAKDFKNTQNLFVIQQGITKVRVYIWLESRDIDMMFETLATNFDINLDFEVIY